MSPRFLPGSFNDLLCLVLVCLIAALWVLLGLGRVGFPPEITGALIVTWTLLVQHYFRKRPPGPGT